MRYATEDARVGQKTDYDRLILEIWTNGTITPEMALVEASKILRKHLNPFVQYFELGSDTANDDAVTALRDATKAMIDPELQQKLNMTVQELDLSVRANNCLESAKIQTVRDLVKKTDADLLKVRSFGKTSLREVKRKLADMGLSLGMDLDAGRPPGRRDRRRRRRRRSKTRQNAEDAGDGETSRRHCHLHGFAEFRSEAAACSGSDLHMATIATCRPQRTEDSTMRHMIRGRQLSRDTEHRKALRRNLVQSLFEHGKIRTTLPKAKEVRAFAEKLITLARGKTLNDRRRVIAMLQDRRLVDEEQEFILGAEDGRPEAVRRDRPAASPTGRAATPASSS